MPDAQFISPEAEERGRGRCGAWRDREEVVNGGGGGGGGGR
jgi:hypothetical protein